MSILSFGPEWHEALVGAGTDKRISYESSFVPTLPSPNERTPSHSVTDVTAFDDEEDEDDVESSPFSFDIPEPTNQDDVEDTIFAFHEGINKIMSIFDSEEQPPGDGALECRDALLEELIPALMNLSLLPVSNGTKFTPGFIHGYETLLESLENLRDRNAPEIYSNFGGRNPSKSRAKKHGRDVAQRRAGTRGGAEPDSAKPVKPIPAPRRSSLKTHGVSTAPPPYEYPHDDLTARLEALRQRTVTGDEELPKPPKTLPTLEEFQERIAKLNAREREAENLRQKQMLKNMAICMGLLVATGGVTYAYRQPLLNSIRSYLEVSTSEEIISLQEQIKIANEAKLAAEKLLLEATKQNAAAQATSSLAHANELKEIQNKISSYTEQLASSTARNRLLESEITRITTETAANSATSTATIEELKSKLEDALKKCVPTGSWLGKFMRGFVSFLQSMFSSGIVVTLCSAIFSLVLKLVTDVVNLFKPPMNAQKGYAAVETILLGGLLWTFAPTYIPMALRTLGWTWGVDSIAGLLNRIPSWANDVSDTSGILGKLWASLTVLSASFLSLDSANGVQRFATVPVADRFLFSVGNTTNLMVNMAMTFGSIMLPWRSARLGLMAARFAQRVLVKKREQRMEQMSQSGSEPAGESEPTGDWKTEFHVESNRYYFYNTRNPEDVRWA
jgi:hypothetical protein